jgi:hypothetical protein
MRRFDKNDNIRRANLLAEKRHLQSKGLISENEELNEVERTSMSEFFGDEDYEFEDRKEQNKYAHQEQPNVSFEPMNDDEEQMAEYVSKYVNSELELSHEMDNYRTLGYQGLSDTVKQGLRNDMDYQSWVQMSHDEDTFRRERGF